ncbi:MAG: polysaccharide biosynthesis/export family protein [Pseudomonadota bacterium]
MTRLFLSLFVLCLMAGAAVAQSAYLIQRGDRLGVQVLEDPGLNSQALVRPDGRISLPIVGAIRAAGRSPEQLSATVRDRLASNFRQPPNVTVSLLATAPEEIVLPEEEEVVTLRIFVLGEVARPGMMEIEEETTALQALAMAGGLSRFAAEDRIQIRSTREDGQEILRIFDYEALLGGAVQSMPLILADGDVILVPERGLFN